MFSNLESNKCLNGQIPISFSSIFSRVWRQARRTRSTTLQWNSSSIYQQSCPKETCHASRHRMKKLSPRKGWLKDSFRKETKRWKWLWETDRQRSKRKNKNLFVMIQSNEFFLHSSSFSSIFQTKILVTLEWNFSVSSSMLVGGLRYSYSVYWA